ncbi:MAG: sigma-70 family RNA polymerase sigma factor [Bacteroidota bacterium]|nr:sigma-70 family RNA polymerase sigma factor [Bacteroidota bacterium]
MDNTERNMTKYSDEDLMALVTERNTKALKVLYDRYGKSVYNFILRYTNSREIAEDLLQETFTKAWFASHSFNPEKGAFKSWLFTIGINLTRNEMIKKRYSYQYIDLEDVITEDEYSGKQDNQPADCFLEHTELKDTIARALEELSPFLKEVVILKHYQKMKFSEIAEVTNTPEGTLKARFHNALGQLKKILQKMEH